MVITVFELHHSSFFRIELRPFPLLCILSLCYISSFFIVSSLSTFPWLLLYLFGFPFIFASLSASLIFSPVFISLFFLLLSLFLLSSPVFFIFLVPLPSLTFLFSCFPLLSSRRPLPIVNDIT